MACNECITLRNYLQGKFNDFIKDSNIKVQSLQFVNIVCESLALIYDYKEEGTSLFLDLYITDAIKTVMSLIPDGEYIQLGKVSAKEESVKMALKQIAPLSRNKWKLYFSCSESHIEYGIFRDVGNPIVPPIETILTTPKNGMSKYDSKVRPHTSPKKHDELHVIRIAKVHNNAVIVSKQDGTAITVLFNYLSPEKGMPIQENINALALEICKKIRNDDSHYDSCLTFAKSLLNKALRESHGALVAVVDKISTKLRDGVIIDDPINIEEIIKNTLQNPDISPTESRTKLEYLVDLITGMFCCDGIIIFNQNFSVMAYNVFIKSKNAKTFGGARSRAFEALCNMIGEDNGITAAFYQSQDGLTKFKN